MVKIKTPIVIWSLQIPRAGDLNKFYSNVAEIEHSDWLLQVMWLVWPIKVLYFCTTQKFVYDTNTSTRCNNIHLYSKPRLSDKLVDKLPHERRYRNVDTIEVVPNQWDQTQD